ncbi:TPA: hypothetical protein JDK12_004859, partial [Salmonella enterica subsp. diarizonae]|nr:hypothetical protein [Salmonella enterica subsp. diarizonae]
GQKVYGAGTASSGQKVYGVGTANSGQKVYGAGTASSGQKVYGAGTASSGQKVYGAGTANSGQKACGTYWQWINQNFIIWRSGFQLSCFLLLGTISTLTEISQQQGAIYGKG